MPAVHDVAAVRRGQALYDDLHHRMVGLAQGPVRNALEEVTGSSVAEGLQDQLRGLQRFLLEEQQPSEVGAIQDDLMAQLRPFVQDDVRKLELDPMLSEAMTREFATALLDAALSRFRANARQRVVSRSDLEALQGKRPDDVWPELDEVLVPYGVSVADAKAIVWAALLQVAEQSSSNDIELPGNLRLSLAMLGRIFDGKPEPSGLGPFEVAHRMLNGEPDSVA